MSASSDQWASLLRRLGDLPERVTGSGADLSPEQLRYLLRFVAAGISVCVAHDNTDSPELGRMVEDRRSWGLDNPDCNYAYTRLSPDGTYLLTGNRGTARHLEIQVNSGHFGDGDFAGWQAVDACTGDDLDLDGDDAFSLLIAADGADADDATSAAGARNRLVLDDRTSFLIVRQYFGDWEVERPADLWIDRLDLSRPPVPLTADAMSLHMETLLQWLDAGAACWAAISEGLLAGEVGEIKPFRPPDDAAGLKGQAYGMGPWRCARDEAVIVEFEPPTALLWSMSLCDELWQSIDFADRQSSLNDAQATLVDGRFVGVIAHDDPGVANWLDPANAPAGTLAVRYLLADGEPAVTLRTVERDRLTDELPSSTAMIEPDQRQGILRRRRLAMQRRYRR